MALEDGNGNNGMVMPVQPMGGYGGYGGGYGVPVMPFMGGFGGGFGNGFGGDWSWILLLLLISNGGWGGFGMGGFGGMMGMGMMDGWGLYPWMNQAEVTTSGFQNAATNSAISSLQNSVTSGFGDVQLGIAGVNQSICQTGNGIQNALCSGFAGTTAAVTGTQNAISQQMAQNELNSLNRSFAEQTANMQGMNAIQSQLAQCCCDNRLGTESLRATVLQENCSDRYEAANNTRDIITNATGNTTALLNTITSGIQSIKDELCNDRLDQERRENANLRTQLNMAQLAASQGAQTAQLIQDNNAQTAALIQRIAPYPTPSFQVGNPYYYNGYGYNNGCCNNGCGCGN